MRTRFQPLPASVRRAIRFCYGTLPPQLRYGRVFRATYGFLQESQHWSQAKLEKFQRRQLSALVAHCYGTVPYYRRTFDEHGVTPRHIRVLADVCRLPFLTKEDIRRHLDELVSRTFSRSDLEYTTTGGSTGTPLGFYYQKRWTIPRELAFVWRDWHGAGYRFGARRIILRVAIIDRVRDGRREWRDFDPTQNALVLSSFDMTRENLPSYIREITRFRPVAIQGYPSSLAVLASFLAERGSVLSGIRCIFTSSESLIDHHRELIARHLGSRIFDHYGQTEKAAYITQCERGSYHVQSEYGIVELIGPDDQPVAREGERGEIVATGYNNFAMPLIRYRTGDMAVYTRRECDCGLPYPIVERIEGRSQDYLVSARGDLMPLTGNYGLVARASPHVEQAQFLQRRKGEVSLRLVRGPGYADADTASIRDALQRRFGDMLSFSLEFVDDIPRTARGKCRFLVQELAVDHHG